MLVVVVSYIALSLILLVASFARHFLWIFLSSLSGVLRAINIG